MIPLIVAKKNVPDELFFKLNNYHKNIKLTIERSPAKIQSELEQILKRKLYKLKRNS